MRPEDKDIIGNTMDRLLDSIQTIFEQANVSLPTRQYLYGGQNGEVAHDCEQLTISFAQAYQGGPGEQAAVPAKCEGPMTGVFIVELVRCIPDKLQIRGRAATAPDPADLTLNSRAQAQDAYLLMEAGLLTGDEYLGSVVNVTLGPPSGGYQAVVLEVATGLF